MKRLLVIGGGAAGMACALTAARHGIDVIVLEKSRKPLRKLAASGNGRGNLLNRGELRYYGDEDFAKAILHQCPPKEVERFWKSLGVSLVEEDGRIYPSCFSAQAAAAALLCAAEEVGVTIRCNTAVRKLHKHGLVFLAECDETIYEAPTLRKNGKSKPGAVLDIRELALEADAIALCCGGSAAPEFYTDGSAYPLACGFGHHLTELKPALSALLTPEAFPAALIGQRAKASLQLTAQNGKLLAESFGEILFADHAVSGIAAMQLARFVQDGSILRMDLRRTVCGEELPEKLLEWLKRRQQSFPGRDEKGLLCGAATEALSSYLAQEKGLSVLAKRIAALEIPITGCRDFSAAQVTAGGLCCKEWNAQTMESRLCSGLYAAGEVLDVDGDCGGFNLMFAVAGGIVCGRSI